MDGTKIFERLLLCCIVCTYCSHFVLSQDYRQLDKNANDHMVQNPLYYRSLQKPGYSSQWPNARSFYQTGDEGLKYFKSLSHKNENNEYPRQDADSNHFSLNIRRSLSDFDEDDYDIIESERSNPGDEQIFQEKSISFGTGESLALPQGLSYILSSLGTQKPLWETSNNLGGGQTSSTVYTFSFQNLFIIVALKVILFTAIFGGFGLPGLAGRSMPEESFFEALLNTEDMLFALAFLNDDLFKENPSVQESQSRRYEDLYGYSNQNSLYYRNSLKKNTVNINKGSYENENNYYVDDEYWSQELDSDNGFECLQRMTCLHTGRAKEIIMASMMMIKAVNLMTPWTSYSMSSSHPALLSMKDALGVAEDDLANDGNSCRRRHSCHSMPSL